MLREPQETVAQHSGRQEDQQPHHSQIGFEVGVSDTHVHSDHSAAPRSGLRKWTGALLVLNQFFLSNRYIQSLKKKEREFEQQLEKLAGDKISAQHRLANLRKDGCSVLPLGECNRSNSTLVLVPSVGNSPDHDILPPSGTEIIASGHLLEPRRALLAATNELVAAERLMSEIKRRGSVSPDNETTTTASGKFRSSSQELSFALARVTALPSLTLANLFRMRQPE